jgi:alpha-beta hydrolase superfamily lysophospholipase
MKITITKVALAIISLFLILLVGVQSFVLRQVHQTFYQDHPASTYTLAEFGLTASEHTITTKDGLKLQALHIPAKDSKATIVIVHGASDDGGKTVMLPYAKFLNQAGYSTVTFALRNYAGGEGNKTTFAVQEWQDVVAAFSLAKQLEPTSKVGLLGVSMGSASLLTAMGKEGIGDFAIVSVPYTTFSAGASWDSYFKMGLPEWFSRPFLDTAAWIELGPDYFVNQPIYQVGKIKVPVLLIPAKNDHKVNPQDSYELQRLGGSNFTLWESQIAEHDVLNTDGLAYMEQVLKFIAANVNSN